MGFGEMWKWNIDKIYFDRIAKMKLPIASGWGI